MRHLIFIVVLTLSAQYSTANDAHAYSIHSGLTEGCHERITLTAFLNALPTFNPDPSLPIPTSAVWQRFANGIITANRLTTNFPQLEDDAFKLMLISTIVGVRSPDTEGHATSNLARLRQIHADPDPRGQYAHALRGTEDDGSEGDEKAIDGMKDALIDLVKETLKAWQLRPEQQLITVPLYFDFYGIVEIEVWAPAYYLGRALHALQDSFAHTIRNDDLTKIRHVLNYVDAIEGHLSEVRDGLPHSAHMDSCDGDIIPISMTAARASAELIAAINRSVETNDTQPTKEFMPRWLQYEPGCTMANDYCDSAWVALARQEQTGPYLDEMLGCRQSYAPAKVALTYLLCFFFLCPRRSPLSRLWVAAFVLMLAAPNLEAKTFIRTEAHASVLSDAPDRSVLASTFGFGFRGGYTLNQWRLIGHVERNYWLSTELSDRVQAGALNVGLGTEYHSAQGFVRTSAVVGISRLQFDTLFHQKGTKGLFVDIRPVELCWQPIPSLGLTLAPLSFAYVSPVMRSPAIRMVLYRSVVGLEGKF